MSIKLDNETLRKIEEIISRDKSAEIGVRNGKVIVWELSSKKKHETAVTPR